MVARHVGLALAEPQRARWVQLIGVAAGDAGLLCDPEFRSAFVAYIEWVAPSSGIDEGRAAAERLAESKG